MKKMPHEHRHAGTAMTSPLTTGLSRQVREALSEAVIPLEGRTPSDEPALTVERARQPLAPALLAASCPGGPAARHEMRALYHRCLVHYRRLRRNEPRPDDVDDVGAAVADFVAANMQALHGTAATPAVRLRLERQLAGIVRTSAAWSQADARDRQLYFEKLAVLAVLIGESAVQAVRQGPAAIDNVQRAARHYLRELLGIDPDRLTLGDAGLALRTTQA
jgi:hypothetical protein